MRHHRLPAERHIIHATLSSPSWMCFFAFVFLLHKLHSSKTSNHLPGSQIFLPEVARQRLAEHFVVDLYKPFMPSPIQAATCFYPRRTLLFGSLKGSTLNPKEPGRDSRWKSLCSCSLSDYTGVLFFFFLATISTKKLRLCDLLEKIGCGYRRRAFPTPACT